MRTGGRYFNVRTYEVSEIRIGKRIRFDTELRVDNKVVLTLRSKKRKLAVAKGERHLLDYYNF